MEYSTSGAVSAKWAFPPGFGIIKPPQDVPCDKERKKGEWCVGECETERMTVKKQNKMIGREIREFGDLGSHVAELYSLSLTLTG